MFRAQPRTLGILLTTGETTKATLGSMRDAKSPLDYAIFATEDGACTFVCFSYLRREGWMVLRGREGKRRRDTVRTDNTSTTADTSVKQQTLPSHNMISYQTKIIFVDGATV